MENASWKWEGKVEVLGVCIALLPKEWCVGVALGLGKFQSTGPLLGEFCLSGGEGRQQEHERRGRGVLIIRWIEVHCPWGVEYDETTLIKT